MEKIEEFGEILKEIKRVQSLALEKYHGYDNLPRLLKKEFDEAQQALLQLLKQI